jgi:DNA-directed RNA polymerase subunit RPC12/RpoP
MEILCKNCKKIIIENLNEKELNNLGEYIQCPYCGLFMLNKYFKNDKSIVE